MKAALTSLSFVAEPKKTLGDTLKVIEHVTSEWGDGQGSPLPLIGMYFISRIVMRNTEKVKRIVVGNITKFCGDNSYLMKMLTAAAVGDGDGDTYFMVSSTAELQKGYRLYQDRELWEAAVQKALTDFKKKL